MLDHSLHTLSIAPDSNSVMRAGTEDCSNNYRQEFLEMMLAVCLQRIGRWSVPPNWSAGAWRMEAAQVAALAALRAVLEYDSARGKSLEDFVAQRMTSRVRTHHRREWAYALRFGSTETCFDETDGENWDWITAAVEPALDWQALREAISHLPTAHQAVLLDLYWNGYTEMEVGARLRVSQCAVNKRKHAGLQILRENLHSAA